MHGMEEDWLVNRRVGSDVRGVRLRGRLRMEWMDDVKRALNEGRMIVHCMIQVNGEQW